MLSYNPTIGNFTSLLYLYLLIIIRVVDRCIRCIGSGISLRLERSQDAHKIYYIDLHSLSLFGKRRVY